MNPYKASSTANTSMVMSMLKLANQTPDIQTQFASSTQQYLASALSDTVHQPDQSLLSDSFSLLPLPAASLQQLASCLAHLPVNMFCMSQDRFTSNLATILIWVCQSLSFLPPSDLSDPILVTVVAHW